MVASTFKGFGKPLLWLTLYNYIIYKYINCILFLSKDKQVSNILYYWTVKQYVTKFL